MLVFMLPNELVFKIKFLANVYTGMPIKRTLLINIDEEIIFLLLAFKNTQLSSISYIYHHCEEKSLPTPGPRPYRSTQNIKICESK